MKKSALNIQSCVINMSIMAIGTTSLMELLTVRKAVSFIFHMTRKNDKTKIFLVESRIHDMSVYSN